MQYVIMNYSSGIKLDENGKPVCCKKEQAQQFEFAKANNILKSMPKTLKNLKFRVVPVSDFQTDIGKKDVLSAKRILSKESKSKKKKDTMLCSESYKVPDQILEWVDKFKNIDLLFKQAKERNIALMKDLEDIERAENNILHEIEMMNNMNACDGYKQYKQLRGVLRKRREIKDELELLGIICTFDHDAREANELQKFVSRLENRKYRYRKTSAI